MSNKHGANWIARDKRLALYLRDGMQCAYCGSVLEDGITLTLDHIIPRQNGGNNAAENLITACHKCNTSRGDRDVLEFITAVALYINNNITAAMIEAHIADCLARDWRPLRMIAKEIINNRSTWGGAIKLADQALSQQQSEAGQ